MDHGHFPVSPDVFRLWAKGAPRESGDPYHPLISHLIDVGVVAERLWAECLPESAREWFAAQVGTDADSAGRWAAFWAGIHDLGKASPAFQTRDAFRTAVPHGTMSAVLLREPFSAPPFGFDIEVAYRLAVVIGGHHGVFPTFKVLNDAEDEPRQLGMGDWKAWRDALLDETVRLLGMDGLAAPTRLTNAGALWLAGFISVADWIGSNSAYFPFAAFLGDPAPDSLDAYAAQARQRAGEALVALGWTAWPGTTAPRRFVELFPFAPNDLQQQTVEVADGLSQPGLVIVEAPMGEGKTEAALYLADRGSAALGMRGCYVALPTQATSNQMFSRVTAFLAHRYPDDLVNTQLLHGHAALAADFRALHRDERSFLEELAIPPDHNLGFDGAKPGVVAADWFTARKRGLLAPYGVGTVDQALLAVLQTRHFFVRLLGLAGKTIIFDEVHAYDAYMSVLLERLLRWLAALGCSVVLLSATLPRRRRERLLRAYGGPLSAEAESDDETAYPRLTWRAGDAAGAIPLRSSRPSRRVHLRWLAPGEDRLIELGDRLETALADGGCAAVICNTVRGAQRTYRVLRDRFAPGEVGLFHARFLYDERSAREAETLRHFGKPGEGVERPRRRVLVATQVIEQSLDLDFDLMVSELAPVDLVLQRSGRLHRHDREDRPARLREPELWLLAPEIRDGLPSFDGGVTHVYAEHILLRSWWALRGREAIVVPDDIAALIELVYDDDLLCPEPWLAERWQGTRDALRADRARHEAIARQRLILPPDYREDGFLERWNNELEEDDPSIHQDLQALTRLGEKTITAVCLMPEEMARLQPRARDAAQRAEPLLRRSVALSDRRIVHELARATPPTSWKSTPLLRYCRLVELDARREAAVGKHRLRLDPELGVVVDGSGEEE